MILFFMSILVSCTTDDYLQLASSKLVWRKKDLSEANKKYICDVALLLDRLQIEFNDNCPDIQNCLRAM